MARRYSMRSMYRGARTVYRAARRRSSGMSAKAKKALKTNKTLMYVVGFFVVLLGFLFYKKALSMDAIKSAFKSN